MTNKVENDASDFEVIIQIAFGPYTINHTINLLEVNYADAVFTANNLSRQRPNVKSINVNQVPKPFNVLQLKDGKGSK